MVRPDGQFDLPKTLFVNGSGESIPAWGVLRVPETAPSARQALDARKPDGTNEDCTLWINLPRARPDGQTGYCTRAPGCYALFDDSGSAPVPGEEWGPDSDWKLHPDKSGFTIVGGIVGSGSTARVRVQPASSGVGAVATIIHGPAASTVSSGTYTLTLSECQVMQGRIPSDVTTITAADTHAWDIQEDQLVWVMLASDKEVGVDNFLTFQAGCPPEEP